MQGAGAITAGVRSADLASWDGLAHDGWSEALPRPAPSAGVPLDCRIEHVFFLCQDVFIPRSASQLRGGARGDDERGEGIPRPGRRGAMAGRVCVVEGCELVAKRGSMHCPVDAQSALGKAARNLGGGEDGRKAEVGAAGPARHW